MNLHFFKDNFRITVRNFPYQYQNTLYNPQISLLVSIPMSIDSTSVDIEITYFIRSTDTTVPNQRESRSKENPLRAPTGFPKKDQTANYVTLLLIIRSIDRQMSQVTRLSSPRPPRIPALKAPAPNSRTGMLCVFRQDFPNAYPPDYQRRLIKIIFIQLRNPISGQVKQEMFRHTTQLNEPYRVFAILEMIFEEYPLEIFL